VAELLELAADAQVAPARILSGEADHEVPEVFRRRRPSRALPPPPPGAAGDQLTVPSQHGLGSDQKAPPAIARQHAGKGGEQHPVLGAETGPTLLALQHVELVAQDQDLDVFGVETSAG
jgi:hypothetical protein